ncbi:sugar (pentulose or hexulose) kinase [Salsuginibacillus halophilus]|uniref:Sugar (Pentulose or hexulose) kinase n=1 Tax=Salsuginibacillus halophilus TaxID=517424 RepID=A0A2P8HL53_9BACI|nr:FGGY family carbohydrate kinase [Salsuginibacillus halophilus]PSL46949.1 sugar (pentulose or hexulose) kinase [Salsuginibacillus halophilus]
MSAAYVLGIDSGSQSTKVVIFDTEGNEAAFGSCPLREPHTPAPGTVIHPDDDLWDSLKQAVHRCLDDFSGDRDAIKAIGLCTIRSCRVLLRKDGSLAQPVISWMDERLAAPYQHEDDSVAYVTSTSGYLGWKLTGEKKDTAANYEVFWPLDRTTLDWSTDDEVLKANGVTREMLFDLVKPGEALGSIKDELAKEFGLNENIPVVATANDKAVEVLGSGVDSETTAMISLGTFISAMLYQTKDWESAAHFFPTLAAVPYRYVYESTGIRRGMWTVSWFKKLIGKELTTQAAAFDKTEEDFLNDQAAEIPAGSEGLITILDWLSSPEQPYRKGLIIGFDERHTAYHMYRSILEAIAFDMKNNIDIMLNEIDGTLEQLIITGGGAKSDVMMQILSDVFGLPARRRKGSSSACLGAAVSACVQLGFYNSFTEAQQSMIRDDAVFSPNSGHHKFYTDLNETVVKHVRSHTDEILKRSHRLFHETPPQ